MSKANANGADLVQGEPSENEPCMGADDAAAAAQANIFTRTRSAACKRWQLTHPVLYFITAVLVLLVVALIVVVVLGATWPHVPHSRRFPACQTPQCLRAASQIRESMNDSASPCSDLWNWACGGWLSKYPLPRTHSVWNLKQQMRNEDVARVRDLIATLRMPLHTSSVEWKLKHLYGACLDVDNVNVDGARPLTSIIAELGGWYVMRDWNINDFDGNSILKQLHVKYGVSPFFQVSVEVDPYFPGKNNIRISPSGLGLPEKGYYFKEQDDDVTGAYKQLIRDVVINLSSTTNDAEKFGNDMFFYERRIAEITPHLQNLQNPLATCNHITISELKTTILNIPFHDILTAMYPESNITETTEVVVTSLEYLTHVSQIIATTDMKTMNGYLIWTLVRNYLPYLSDKFTSVVTNFNKKLFGVREPPNRWEICVNLVQKFMHFAINVMIETNNRITSGETVQFVNSTFNTIVDAVKIRINKFKNYPDLYKQLRRKLFNLRLQIGLPGDVQTEQYVKSYYTKLRIIKSNLFESVRFSIAFKKKLEDRLLMKQSAPEDAVIDSLQNEFTKVSYSPAHNLVIVPRLLLMAPLFESKFPLSVNYGRLGVDIANAVLAAVLPYDSFWTSDKKLLSPYHLVVNYSLWSINNDRQCLHNYLTNLNLGFNITHETDLVALKHLSAVSVAHAALMDVLATKNHIHQPALEEFEDSALFFLTYSQMQCSQSTSHWDSYKNSVQFELPEKHMLQMAWKQLPQFSESLECSLSDKSQCSDLF